MMGGNGGRAMRETGKLKSGGRIGHRHVQDSGHRRRGQAGRHAGSDRYGMHESDGMKKGMVVNIEATVGAIRRALEEAELMADCKISEVYTGIAGSHIRSINSRGW